MRRRDFIKLIAGSAVSWPLTAGAQQAGKLPTIGFLGAAKRSAYSQWDAAFVQRLRELGWIEGRTITIEYRWAEGRSDRRSGRHRSGREVGATRRQRHRSIEPAARRRW